MITLLNKYYEDKFKLLAEVDALSHFEYNKFAEDLEQYLIVNNKSLFKTIRVLRSVDFNKLIKSTQLDSVAIVGEIVINDCNINITHVLEIKNIFNFYTSFMYQNSIYNEIIDTLLRLLIYYIKDKDYYLNLNYDYKIIEIKGN